jgi:heme-degrading monooxygenase HmoA
MFSRIVEINAKPGKGKELVLALGDKTLEILREQPGFVDMITFQSKDNADHVIGISFWKTQEDAIKYNAQAYPRVLELVRNVSEGPGQVRTFDVTLSTAHKIVRAA